MLERRTCRHHTSDCHLVTATSDCPRARVGAPRARWGLSYAKLREVALGRARQATGLPGGLPLTQLPLERWRALHTPLPLGFLSAPLLQELCEGGSSAAVSLREATAAVCDGMAFELARRLIESEPDRWGGEGEATAPATLVETLGLVAAARRMLTHYQSVLAVQATMYRRAAPPPLSAAFAEDTADAATSGVAAGRPADQAALGVIMGQMDVLDAHMASLDAWGRGDDSPPPSAVVEASAPAAAAGGGLGAKAGFGGGGGGKGGGGKKAKGKKRK